MNKIGKMTAAPSTILNWASKDGEFRRQTSTFREHIKAGTKFEAEADRYHLYVSLACPWASRTLIMRELKGLASIITCSVVHYEMGPEGWHFPSSNEECAGATIDHLYNSKFVKELYFRANKDYVGRYTVPILWDKKYQTIVNNESSEIIRIFNTAFNDLIGDEYKKLDFYPPERKEEIDLMNDYVYDRINNGVYKAGFASERSVYEAHVKSLFEGLDKIEDTLSKTSGPYLLGADMTEADVRIFPTLIRFDSIYVQHFKCNIGTIRHNYPAIHKYLKNLYWNHPREFKATTDFDHIKNHYSMSHAQLNPFAITALGPLPHIEPL